MNANIKKYDLKGHIRSNKAFYVNLFSSNNSSVKPTLPLMAKIIAFLTEKTKPSSRKKKSKMILKKNVYQKALIRTFHTSFLTTQKPL